MTTQPRARRAGATALVALAFVASACSTGTPGSAPTSQALALRTAASRHTQQARHKAHPQTPPSGPRTTAPRPRTTPSTTAHRHDTSTTVDPLTSRSTTTSAPRTTTTAATPVTTTTTAVPPAPGGTPWAPAPGQPWQWILASPLSSTDAALAVPTFDIDGFDNPTATVTSLHSQNKHAICYIDVGTWENWRPDASAFPSSVLGNSNGWPGERWLDIRQLSTLGPILHARFQMCHSKGFDAVEADNVDGYSNSTGFPLTAADQLAFNRWVAGDVHSLGMSVALKNDVDQAADLQPAFDFAVDEQCFQYDECDALTPFTTAGKAVLEVEYSGSLSTFCPVTSGQYHFASMLKDLDLTAYRKPCP